MSGAIDSASPAAAGTGSAGRTRDLALGAAVVLAYFAAAQTGFRLAFVAEQVTTVWAPTGIALGTLALCGLRFWPAVWLGAFLANAVTTAPIWTALLIASGNTLEAVTAVLVFRRYRQSSFTFSRVGDVLTFLITVLVCTPISATIGVLTLCAGGVQAWERFQTLWLAWWFGDVLGAVLVTPAILTTVRHPWSRRDALRAAAFVAGAIVVAHLVFGQVLGVHAHPLEYAIFPVVIGAAATGGLAVTALVALSASVVAVWHTVHGAGPSAAQGVHEALILLQLGVLAATSLLLGAAIAERRASETRERNAATMLRLAQRAGGVATFEWDFRRQAAQCSAEFFELFGLPPIDGVMTEFEWRRFVHPDDADAITAHLSRALEGTEPASADYRIVRTDGSVRWVTYAGQIRRTDDGERMLGTVVDITDRKRLEADLRRHSAEVIEADTALRESRDVLSLAMRGGSMGTWSRNLATNDVWWSRELEEIFGLEPGGFARTEEGFFDFIHPDDRGVVRAVVDEAVMGRRDYVVEFRFKPQGGEWRWMEGRGRAVYGEDGKARSLYGIGIDVTERKRAEIALQHAKAAAEEGQLRLADANRELARRIREQETLLDVLPIGIGIATDAECRHIHTNRAFAETLGLSRDANASLTAPEGERPSNFRVFTPQGVEVPDDQLPMQIAAREGREVRNFELDIVQNDGRRVRLLEYAAPVFDEHGRSRGAIGAFVDVTAAHQAREKLERSEERYRRIFETAGVSLWELDFTAVQAALGRLRAGGVSDLAGYLAEHPDLVEECAGNVTVVEVNPATLRMFRAKDRNELAASLTRIFPPDARAMFRGELLALAQGQRRYEAETRVQTLDGRRLDVVRQVAFPAPGEPADRVLVSLTDITDRKRAEMSLRQEVEVRTILSTVGASLAGELRSDRLIQAVTDASTKLTDAEFGAFFYNVSGEQGDAYVLHALSGAPKEAFSTSLHPRATGIFAPTFRGEAIIRLDDVTADPRYGRNPPFRGMPDGHPPVRSYLAVPVIGRDGIVLGGLFFGHSQPGVFTQRHELLAAGVAGWAAIALDNARLYQEAAEANRLKDEFLATLSHELRTPLNAVLGWAHMLREGSVPPGMRERALESVERNARVQVQLVEDLLDVSRIMAGKLQVRSDVVDLAAVVTNAVDTVRAGVTAKRLDLRVLLPAHGRVTVSGDPDRLQQVVWNLVSNAVKFTPAGGRIDVELRCADGKAEITVRDTGQGIEPAFRPHLFQRFRQMDASKTRQHGGLGLGLSIVRHLVEAHGGTVAAESEGLDRGATFRVQLPLRSMDEAAADAAGAGVLPRPRALNGVRALVVDDEADARELARFVLESRGAAVIAAASAGDALQLLAREPFDVLVADIGMPGRNGLELIRALRTSPDGSPNREIPAIALTAYTSVREREEAAAAGFNSHVGKPADATQLAVAVATLVGRVDLQP